MPVTCCSVSRNTQSPISAPALIDPRSLIIWSPDHLSVRAGAPRGSTSEVCSPEGHRMGEKPYLPTWWIFNARPRGWGALLCSFTNPLVFLSPALLWVFNYLFLTLSSTDAPLLSSSSCVWGDLGVLDCVVVMAHRNLCLSCQTQTNQQFLKTVTEQGTELEEVRGQLR